MTSIEEHNVSFFVGLVTSPPQEPKTAAWSFSDDADQCKCSRWSPALQMLRKLSFTTGRRKRDRAIYLEGVANHNGNLYDAVL